MTFQQIVLALQKFWSKQGCVLGEAYDTEKGAGTMNPATFLRTIGPEPWNVAYMEPSRRPDDGRYGDNPNRLYQHHQFQVIMKPSPNNIQETYLESLKELGIDGMEITQFTYFQQVGGIDEHPVSVEITYGLERIAMYIQEVDNVYDLEWTDGVTYGDIWHQNEYEQSVYSYELSDHDMLFKLFDMYEKEAQRVVKAGLVLPAYDYVLKCSHSFNLLDAAGAISLSERTEYISRVRNLARMCAKAWLKKRKELGFPMLKGGEAK